MRLRCSQEGPPWISCKGGSTARDYRRLFLSTRQTIPDEINKNSILYSHRGNISALISGSEAHRFSVCSSIRAGSFGPAILSGSICGRCAIFVAPRPHYGVNSPEPFKGFASRRSDFQEVLQSRSVLLTFLLLSGREEVSLILFPDPEEVSN
jgi:hypothetical protein